jgi:hypothetical protein
MRLPPSLRALLLCASAVLVPTAAAAAAGGLCAATAARETASPRIQQAIDEAARQHLLFGGQTIERNGGLFRVGYHEAEWDRPPLEATPTWERVATFWRALSDSDPPALLTALGRTERAEASAAVAAAAGSVPARADVAMREALLRAAIVDTPWSAAFISYLMKMSGFSRAEFAFSDSHADYVQAAIGASAAEAEGRESFHAFRACDVRSTPPRAGDLLCATRATAAATDGFAALPAAIAAARLSGHGFPMHCDLVVRSDAGGDAKLETIGGNVVQSVTLSRMTLNASKVLGSAYFPRSENPQARASRGPGVRDNLNRRPWVVVLQFRG